MRDIRASMEVLAFIGAGKLRELHGDTYAQYECCQCGSKGQTTEPTSIVVFGYRVFRVVKLAHANCADSQIIEVDAATLRAAATAAGQLVHRITASPLLEHAGRFDDAGTGPVRRCPA